MSDKVQDQEEILPLQQVKGVKGYSFCIAYEGQEIAVTARTRSHLRKVFKLFSLGGVINTEKVIGTVLLPQEINLKDQPQRSTSQNAEVRHGGPDGNE